MKVGNKPHLTEVTSTPEEEVGSATRDGWTFLAELRKRKVCRTAVSYMLVMWLNLQIGDVVFPMMGLPDWSLSLIIIVGVMGFPVVLILAWAFQVTPGGIVLDEYAEPEEKIDRQLDTVVNLLLLVFSIALSILLLLQIYSDERRSFLMPVLTEEPPTVVISRVSFESATGKGESQIIAAGLREELRHRLINLEGVEVLPNMAAVEPDESDRRLALSGSLLLDDGKAHFLAHLIDLSAGRYLMSVSFNLQKMPTLALEIAAAERIFDEFSKVLREEEAILISAKTDQGDPEIQYVN